jgi:drug/metabolite transporter (DMT)-like permease
MGLQREKAGRAVSATYLQIVFASVYQLVFLHIPIQLLSGIGMVVILLAAGWVAAGKA